MIVLKYALLGFLNYRPMSGYELKSRMDRSTMHFWHARLSQVYVTLKALEEEGLATSALEEQNERPDKRVFAITPAGRQALRGWLSLPVTEISPKKETVILKLFFSGGLERETILTGLRVQRDLHARQAEQYRAVIARDVNQAAQELPEAQRDALLWEATRRFGEAYEDLYVRWLDETIALIESEF